MQLSKNFKKIILSSAFAMLFTANAYAIPKGPCDQKLENVCCEDPKPGPFAFSYPKDIGLSCPKDFYFSADYILMQAKQDGMDYAIADSDGGNNSGDFQNGPLTGGTLEGLSSNNNDWGWDSGFRINIGFYLNHDAWNLDGQWTWFRFTEDESSTVKGNARLLPFWLVPTAQDSGDGPRARDASARWKMNYNVFDIALGKPYHISRYVVFSPHFGIRAAWIDQNYLARYGGMQADSALVPNVQDGAEMNANNDFWGVGTRAGFLSEWILGSGWSLYGNAAASILFSKFDINQSVANNNNSYNIEQKFYTNTPNFEILLGVGYNLLFNKERHRFSVRAAYEFHQWWDINRMRRFFDNQFAAANDAVSRGDLTLNGVSFKVAFDF